MMGLHHRAFGSISSPPGLLVRLEHLLWQAHLEAARTQVGEAGATMQQHLGNYAEYQEAINRSNEVRSCAVWLCGCKMSMSNPMPELA